MSRFLPHKAYKHLRKLPLRTMLVVLWFVFLPSCDNASEPENDKAQVRIAVDWSDYGKETPTGMTVICYPARSGETVRSTSNNTSGVTARLSPGSYQVAVFNLTEEEFDNVRFCGLESAETAEAYAARQDAPQWYTTPVEGNNYIAEQPEWLATDRIQIDPVVDPLFEVGKVIGTLRPRNIVYTLHIALHTDNIGNLRAVRGAISGLADGRGLAAERPNGNTQTVTHLIGAEDWTRRRTSATPDTGVIEADVRCFGLPGNHRGTAEENRLELHVLLADGETVMRYELPVGHLIREPEPVPDGRGDRLDLYLEGRLDPPLPPATGDDGCSGMDIWLDDWDDQVDFDILI